MYTLANFDDKEYKKLISHFSRSRRGKVIENFYQELMKLKPGDFISDALKIKLDRWCETPPSNSWGAARPYARQIRDMILDRTHGGGEYVHAEMVHPPLSINLGKLFHTPWEYDPCWNAMYGITETRKRAMVKDTGPDSLHNPNSETFLTFFSLANLDIWQQPRCLAKPIRTRDDKLNDDFFTTMRLNKKDLWLKPKEIHFNPSHMFSKLGTQKKEMKYSIFFFELDIMSSKLNSSRGRVFKALSFLDISKKTGWSEFDGFIFLPALKRCIFIESKLGSDIHGTVKWRGHNIPFSQIARALESAYLFTHHPYSAFHGWEYDYLFICPRQKYESERTKYSQIIPRIQDPKSTVLNDEYLNLPIDSDPVKKPLFEDFLSTHYRHIHVLFWDQLFKILEENDPGFLSRYMENLQLKDKSMYETWRSRLNLASIPYKK
jgi:hypothetical protein